MSRRTTLLLTEHDIAQQARRRRVDRRIAFFTS